MEGGELSKNLARDGRTLITHYCFNLIASVQRSSKSVLNIIDRNQNLLLLVERD